MKTKIASMNKSTKDLKQQAEFLDKVRLKEMWEVIAAGRSRVNAAVQEIEDSPSLCERTTKCLDFTDEQVDESNVRVTSEECHMNSAEGHDNRTAYYSALRSQEQMQRQLCALEPTKFVKDVMSQLVHEEPVTEWRLQTQDRAEAQERAREKEMMEWEGLYWPSWELKVPDITVLDLLGSCYQYVYDDVAYYMANAQSNNFEPGTGKVLFKSPHFVE